MCQAQGCGKKKLIAHLARGGALNDSREVQQLNVCPLVLDDTRDTGEGGELIRGSFGLGFGDGTQQGGFADRRESDQRHLCADGHASMSENCTVCSRGSFQCAADPGIAGFHHIEALALRSLGVARSFDQLAAELGELALEQAKMLRRLDRRQ